MQNSERKIEMEKMYAAGKTLQAIGDRFKVSRERVRQIIGHGEQYDQWRAEHKMVHLEDVRCRHCGKLGTKYKFQHRIYCDRDCFKAEKRAVLVGRTHKWCSKCQKNKPVSEFYPSYKRGYHPATLGGYCKSCRGIVNRKWAERNPEKRREGNRIAALAYYHRKRLAKLQKNVV